MLVLVSDLFAHLGDDILKLGRPYTVQFIHLLVTHDAVLGQRRDEILRCFGVLLGLNTLRFGGCLSIFLTFICSSSCLLHRSEQVRGRKDLVEILKLLTSLDFVRLLDRFFINFIDVWESIHYESAEKDSIGYFVIFNTKAFEVSESFEFGNLDE